jgi:hypothetical protein
MMTMMIPMTTKKAMTPVMYRPFRPMEAIRLVEKLPPEPLHRSQLFDLLFR